MSLYQKAYFLLSAAKVKQLPPDQGIEIAIVGRSNAGKSSVLNCLTHNKKLARVSKTPGRTQHINVFMLDEQRRLIDLPGYGFANVPLAAKLQWQKTVNQYVEERQSLKGLLLVMDIRHPLKELDQQLLAYCATRGLAVHILLNKADKLSKGAAAKTKQMVTAKLIGYHNPITLQVFSAVRNAGTDELRKLLNVWYGHA
ncbi:MAG TPA: ribosome biogenesis GTP-binding protein YihA/YsxC [Gammaproteobacteria bacterium]|nr:ribosome biogenesis GTP-binding protein YihA/YsxC [Gammaproteobacteria bacterium]